MTIVLLEIGILIYELCGKFVYYSGIDFDVIP